jgi:hypothetical protein
MNLILTFLNMALQSVLFQRCSLCQSHTLTLSATQRPFPRILRACSSSPVRDPLSVHWMPLSSQSVRLNTIPNVGLNRVLSTCSQHVHFALIDGDSYLPRWETWTLLSTCSKHVHCDCDRRVGKITRLGNRIDTTDLRYSCLCWIQILLILTS